VLRHKPARKRVPRLALMVSFLETVGYEWSQMFRKRKTLVSPR
jgi:hypothetical protein